MRRKKTILTSPETDKVLEERKKEVAEKNKATKSVKPTDEKVE